MPLLGADTEGLTTVGTGFVSAGAAATESGTSVVNTCDVAVTSILSEMERAERTCLDAIQNMADTNRQATEQLNGIEYTGPNADIARQQAAELQQRCVKAQADMQAAFGDARTSVTAMGESVIGIATDYNAYATQVGESDEVFARNMEVQRNNLEQAMSSFGG